MEVKKNKKLYLRKSEIRRIMSIEKDALSLFGLPSPFSLFLYMSRN